VALKAYLGTDSSPGVVHRVNFDVFNFSWEASLPLDSGENDLSDGVLDPVTGHAWFTTHTAPGRVVGIDLSSFTRVGSLTLDQGENDPEVLLVDSSGPFLRVITDGETVLSERLVRLADLEGAPFVTTWQSDNPGSSGDAQLTIPTAGVGYDYDLHWESLDPPGHSGWLFDLNGSTTVDLDVIGRHRVSIYGDFPRIYFNSAGDRLKILSVEQWGDIEWSSMFNAFSGAANLELNAPDAPDLSGATTIAHMFRGASSLNSDVGHWDVSTIADMRSVFHTASAFDRSLGDWSISAVTDMSGMLANAGLSTASYDATLAGWAAQTVQTGVTLTATGLAYCAASDRQALLDEGWSILGDSLAPGCAGTPPPTPVLDSPPDSATDIPVEPVLSWNAASGANLYELQVATDSSFSSLVVDTTGISATSRQVSGLDYLTLYYWRVRALNDAGNSAYSTIRKFTTEDDPAMPPPTPVLDSPPDLATGISVEPTLAWNPAAGAEAYRLQISESASFSTVVFDQAGITTTSVDIDGLDGDTAYYWRVRASNGAGSSSFSDSWRFTTEANQSAPTAPNPLSPSDTATGVPLDAVLAWDEPVGAESYRVQVSLDASFTSLVADESGLGASSFAPPGLQAETDYFWRVQAANGAGMSDWSVTFRFKTEDAAADLIFASDFEAD
jgi:surface protein